MSFSDRLGITEPRSALQIEGIDEALRNGLWQACIEYLLRESNRYYPEDSVFQRLMSRIYVDFFKQPSDTVPYGQKREYKRLGIGFSKRSGGPYITSLNFSYR
jgi:hypothetical protein